MIGLVPESFGIDPKFVDTDLKRTTTKVYIFYLSQKANFR